METMMTPDNVWPMRPIGYISSCYKERFGIPRQPGLVTAESSEILLLPEFSRPEAVQELSGYSHVWVIFIFHGSVRKKWSPTVRPPRAGGNSRVGVFATRSPFRPNPVGLSVVSYHGYVEKKKRIALKVKGGDFLDQTPVIDIKPYVPYVDAVSGATSSFASGPPAGGHPVHYSGQAMAVIRRASGVPDLAALISQVLGQDPRPAYSRVSDSEGKRYGVRIFDFDVKWEVRSDHFYVTDIIDAVP